jgi:hypothetical protein|nr:MAG TPA: hypothetical protein [Caudoviricetes sp.]
MKYKYIDTLPSAYNLITTTTLPLKMHTDVVEFEGIFLKQELDTGKAYWDGDHLAYCRNLYIVREQYE